MPNIMAPGPSGAADGPGPGLARRLTDVKDYSDTATHRGRTTGTASRTAGDEQEVTA